MDRLPTARRQVAQQWTVMPKNLNKWSVFSFSWVMI